MFVRPVGSTLDDAAASAHRVGRTNAAIREHFAPADILAALRDPTDLRGGSSSDDSDSEWPDTHVGGNMPDAPPQAAGSAVATGAGAGTGAGATVGAGKAVTSRWRHVRAAVHASAVARKSWRKLTVRLGGREHAHVTWPTLTL